MGYRLGKHSKKELVGVDSDLVLVVNTAIEITTQDFTVYDGVRTRAEQREYVRTGVSHTMKSRHLVGEAVDLVPYINGKLRWEWEPIYKIARAMIKSANRHGIHLLWGGVWDRKTYQLGKNLQTEILDYGIRRTRLGKKVFIDGPHFQLSR